MKKYGGAIQRQLSNQLTYLVCERYRRDIRIIFCKNRGLKDTMFKFINFIERRLLSE